MHGLDLTANEWSTGFLSLRVDEKKKRVFSLLNYSWDENSILQLAKPPALSHTMIHSFMKRLSLRPQGPDHLNTECLIAAST